MKISKIVKPDQNIISITKTLAVVELPIYIGPTFMKLAEYIRKQGAEIESAPFVSYKNLDEQGNANAEKVEVEIGFPIDDLIEEMDGMKVYKLPSYQAVTTLFVGKYEGLTQVYQELLAEIRNIGGSFTGICYEYYLSDEEIPEELQETLIEVAYI